MNPLPMTTGRQPRGDIAPRPDGSGRIATVLFLHHGRDWVRGSERCLIDLAANIDPRRYRSIVMCNAPALAEAAARRGIEVRVTGGWASAGDRLLPERAHVREIGDVADEAGVVLIHANSLMPIKAALAAARTRRIPVVAHLHLNTTAEERLYNGLHQVAAAVGVSEHAVGGLRRDGMPPERVRVIHNGVDEAALVAHDAGGLRRALGWSRQHVVFTAVTSLIDIKGIDILLRALDIARRSAPDVRLALVGSGPQAERYARLATDLGLGEHVRFLGDRADVGAVLRDASDVAVTASRLEAFPLNVLEAGAVGLPTIASDIPAHREALIHERTGLLVPMDSADDFAHAMLRLVREPLTVRALGDAARTRVRERFTLERFVRDFEHLYDELRGRPPSAYGWRAGTCWPRAYTRWIARTMQRRIRGRRE